MNFKLTDLDGVIVAEVIADGIAVRNTQDALNLLANSGYQGADHIILRESHLAPAFFDLKTGLAGDILQKFSNYRVKVAIVGDFGRYSGKSLRDFMHESNKRGAVNFVGTLADAWAVFKK